MHPTLVEWQGLPLHTWGLMVTLAFVAACTVCHNRAPQVGVDSDKLVPLYLVVTFVALAGARLSHFVLAEPERFARDPGAFLRFTEGGFTFYGGVVFGILSGVVCALVQKIPVWKMADIAAACIMLGLAIGRLGCFMAGCCHGTAVAGSVRSSILSLDGGSIVLVDGAPWLALVYVKGVGVGSIHGLPVYPTQLWESAAAFGLFLLLSWMWRNARRFDGQVLAAMLMLYAIVRSTVEAFRGDEIRGLGWFGLLSTGQMVSAFMFLAGVAVVAFRATAGVAPETEFRPAEEV